MVEISREICCFILLYFSFSVLGWCMEVTLKYFQYHRFINRGFLIGPYCPIYGSGAVFVTLTVGAFSSVESSYGMTFIISFIVCGVLEYFVSYYLEKHFHARWWDYSQKPMNLNGRVWIGNLILFGVGGTFIVKIADPFLFGLYERIPAAVLYALACLIAAVMAADNVVSHFVMKFVKTSVESSEADNTETISREIRALLSDRSALHRRIAEAYPNVIYKTDRITRKMQEVRSEMDKIRKEAADHIESVGGKIQEQKQSLMSLMESASEIKDGIIRNQEELITLLDSGDKDAEKMKRIRADIDAGKKQLESKRSLFVLIKGRQ